jgi:hypothetical protein
VLDRRNFLGLGLLGGVSALFNPFRCDAPKKGEDDDLVADLRQYKVARGTLVESVRGTAGLLFEGLTVTTQTFRGRSETVMSFDRLVGPSHAVGRFHAHYGDVINAEGNFLVVGVERPGRGSGWLAFRRCVLTSVGFSFASADMTVCQDVEAVCAGPGLGFDPDPYLNAYVGELDGVETRRWKVRDGRYVAGAG